MKRMQAWISGFVLAGLCFVLTSARAAQEADSAVQEPADERVASSEAIEEVEIIGRRPLQFLIEDMNRAEERMFDLFNALNDNSAFRVVCREVIVTGSLIPDRECVPAYIDRARKQSAQDFLQFGIPQKTDEEIWFETRDKQQQFNAMIRQLAVEHPELAESMFELQARKVVVEDYQENQREQNKGWLGRLFSGKQDEDRQ